MKICLKTLCLAITLLMSLIYTPLAYAGKGPAKEKVTKVNVNKKDKTGELPLERAVRENDLEEVRELIKIGADVKTGKALHVAAENGHIEVIQILINAGASIEAQDYRDTALHIAAKNGQVEVIKILIKARANIEARGSFDTTALHMAVINNQLEAVQTLIEARANIEAQHQCDSTALRSLNFAIAMGHSDTTQELADTEALYKCNITALDMAAGLGNIEIVKVLLEAGLNQGVDLKVADNNDWTALHVIAGCGKLNEINSLRKAYNNGKFVSDTSYKFKETIQALIEAGVDKEAEDKDGRTALHCAAFQDRANVVEALIQAKANIEAIDKDDMTVLHRAMRSNPDENIYFSIKNSIEILITAHANIDALDKEGKTALQWAAHENRVDAIELLLQKKANIHAQDKNQSTALHEAARQGSVKAMEALIRAGASIEAKDNEGRTPLHVAAEYGEAQGIQALIRAKANKEATDNNSNTALHVAARQGSIMAMRALIQAKANVEAKDENDETPLHVASGSIQAGCTQARRQAYEQAQIIKELVRLKADMQNQDQNLSTALEQAERHKNIEAIQRLLQKEMIKILINAQADIKAKDKKGKTALHAAAFNGKAEVIKKLIEAGVYIETQDNQGRTAFQQAAAAGQLNAMYSLFQAGANTKAKDKQGRTALHWAAFNGQVEATERLIVIKINIEEQDKDGRTPLHCAAYNGEVKIIEALLNNGAQIQAQDKQGSTPLHVAAYRGNVEAIRALLQAGANVEAKDINGRTALHCAAKLGKIKALTALHELHADLQSKDNEDNTALHLAAIEAHLEMIKYLKELGVYKLYSTNKAGHTPFMVGLQHKHAIQELLSDAAINGILENRYTQLGMAASNGDLVMVQLLMDHGADADVKDKKGYTALDRAKLKGQDAVIDCFEIQKNNLLLKAVAKKGNINLVKRFLSAGAQIDHVDKQGHPAIYHAATKGRIAAVAYLLEQGADLSLLDNNDLMVIRILLTKYDPQYIDLFKRLLALQKNIHMLDAQGCTLLHLAAQYADRAFVGYLLEQGLDHTVQDEQGCSALYYSAIHGNIDIVAYLAEQGADWKLLFSNNLKPLQILLPKYQLQYFALLKNLVGLQQDIQGVDQQGRTLLHLAVQYANMNFIKFLLEKGIDPAIQDDQGQTILHKAVENDDEAVFLTVAHNCQSILHTVDHKKETALHKAARTGSARLIELCEEYQLDFTAHNGRGQTPLEVAMEANRPEVIINAIKQAMRWSSSEVTSTPAPSVRGPCIWSACEIGKALNTELAVAYKRTNQTSSHDTDDDDDDEMWYAFREVTEDFTDELMDEFFEDDGESPQAYWVVS